MPQQRHKGLRQARSPSNFAAVAWNGF
jgi:hypothetical protein